MADEVPSLDDLIKLPSQQDVIDQEILPEARARGAKVTSWDIGDIYYVFAFIVSRLYVLGAAVELHSMPADPLQEYVTGGSAGCARTLFNTLVRSKAPRARAHASFLGSGLRLGGCDRRSMEGQP